MADTVGVPINDVIESVIASYQQGLKDAITYLENCQKTLDIDKMRKSIYAEIQKTGQIKTEW